MGLMRLKARQVGMMGEGDGKGSKERDGNDVMCLCVGEGEEGNKRVGEREIGMMGRVSLKRCVYMCIRGKRNDNGVMGTRKRKGGRERSDGGAHGQESGE